MSMVKYGAYEGALGLSVFVESLLRYVFTPAFIQLHSSLLCFIMDMNILRVELSRVVEE